MRKKREVRPVTLTMRQRDELEDLWFYYGNYGPQTTKGNHSFIQELLDHGVDTRPLRQSGYLPTAECERAVERVLAGEGGTAEESTANEESKEMRLRLVHRFKERRPVEETELKALIDQVRGRMKSKQGSEAPITPEAA